MPDNTVQQGSSLKNKIDFFDSIYNKQFDQKQFMTVEDLLTWCESKMTDLDSKIRNLTDNQDKLAKCGESLQKAQNLINGLAAQWKDKVDTNSNRKDPDGGDASCCQKLEDTIQQLRDAANVEGCPNPGQLNAAADKLERYFAHDSNGARLLTGDGCPYLTQDVTRDMLTQDAKSMQPDIDACQSEASMNMLQVQSVVSKREQAIQLVSNITRKFDEMAGSVISNMK